MARYVSDSEKEEWDAFAARLIYMVRAGDLAYRYIKSLWKLEQAIREDRLNGFFGLKSEEERWHIIKRVCEARKLPT